MEKISNIWKDPVWSKIISATILGTFGFLFVQYKKLTFSFELYLIFVLFCIVLISILMIFHYQKKVKYYNYFDREYKKVKVHLKYSLNDEGFLDLDYTSERILKCVRGQINYISIGPSSSEESYKKELIETPVLSILNNYDKNRLVYEDIYRNTGQTIKFNAKFTTPLQENEEFGFIVKYKIKNNKYAYKDNLTKIANEKQFFSRTFEFNNFTISFPNKEIYYTIEFDKKCNIKIVNLKAYLNQIVSSKENEIINNLIKRKINNDGNLEYSFKRKNPPIKIKYQWEWTPPLKKVNI